VGRLIEGRWSTDDQLTKGSGAFVRGDAAFRNWITPDGAPGPSGEGGFPAGAGRYHLYVSYACPWAHRTLVFRALKGLEDILPVSVVSPKMPDSTGWTFRDEGSTGDALYGLDHLYQLYQ
jgi:putative glutathione S-transferase